MGNKEYCIGCYNNIYNTKDKDCWSLESAKMVKRKEVHISTKPPFDNCRIRKVNDCYRQPKHIYIKPSRNY